MLRPPNPAIAVLFACAALASTGMFTAITLGAIAAVETAGSRAASGLPAALAILGTAIGAVLLGALMGRRTWRLGMRVGWLVGAGGGVLAAGGVQQEQFLPVLGGMFAIGFGNAGTQLARYAAAVTVSPAMRGVAVGWIVWAAAVGAVVGPLSLGITGALAARAGYAPGVGGFGLVVASLLCAAAVVSLFRPVAWEESAAALSLADAAPPDPERPVERADLVAAIGSLVAAQACMVMVMAVTPVHLDDGGHAYGVVGTVMSGHFIGMFALAPLVGWLVDQVTPAQAVRTGLMTLGVGALLAAALPVAHGSVLSLPLLIIGLGWCICFVSASAAVASAVSGPRAQGRVDALVWIGSATSSTLAGVLLAATTYGTVALTSAALVTVVALVAGARLARAPIGASV